MHAVSVRTTVKRTRVYAALLQWFRSFARDLGGRRECGGTISRRVNPEEKKSAKMAEEQARQLAERVATLESELQATLQANAELTRGLQEQREVAETAQLRADRRGRAQM